MSECVVAGPMNGLVSDENVDATETWIACAVVNVVIPNDGVVADQINWTGRGTWIRQGAKMIVRLK